MAYVIIKYWNIAEYAVPGKVHHNMLCIVFVLDFTCIAGRIDFVWGYENNKNIK